MGHTFLSSFTSAYPIQSDHPCLFNFHFNIKPYRLYQTSLCRPSIQTEILHVFLIPCIRCLLHISLVSSSLIWSTKYYIIFKDYILQFSSFSYRFLFLSYKHSLHYHVFNHFNPCSSFRMREKYKKEINYSFVCFDSCVLCGT